jgi:hypothetical protein
MMVYAFAPPLAAIGQLTWQSWIAISLLVVALAALVVGRICGGPWAAKGSLLSENPQTRGIEIICAVLFVLCIIKACAFFIWSTVR